MSALAFASLDLTDYAASLNARLRGLSAPEILQVAMRDLFPGEVALVSSFGAEAAVLLHLAASVDRSVPVLFLETGKHFQQTLDYRNTLVDRLGLTDVRNLTPDARVLAAQDAGGTLWFKDTDACCRIRKVEPLERALKPFAASISGRKRFQSSARAKLDTVEVDGARLKFNPLADWDAAALEAYARLHDLPRHPLVAEGYPSIGCAPCTQPVSDGEDARAGRWRGSDKTECGIHGRS